MNSATKKSLQSADFDDVMSRYAMEFLDRRKWKKYCQESKEKLFTKRDVLYENKYLRCFSSVFLVPSENWKWELITGKSQHNSSQ
jgi:hypothetical protein